MAQVEENGPKQARISGSFNNFVGNGYGFFGVVFLIKQFHFHRNAVDAARSVDFIHCHLQGFAMHRTILGVVAG